jgi:DNA-binding PadR family transcriptional regulator
MTTHHLTYSTAVVLQAIASEFQYGFDIMDATGLPSGTVYPILRRLERNGWLRSAWEDESKAHGEQRPARRYYELTRAGTATLAAAQARYRGLDRLFVEAPREADAKEARA